MFTPESRREYLEQLGGQSAVMRKLGLKHRQTVGNWIVQGFADEHKPALRAAGEELGIEPHPELLVHVLRPTVRQPTPLRDWLHVLSKACGGFAALSEATHIPDSSLRKMCERKSGIMPLHVPALERVARKKRVPLPDFWQAARAKNKAFMARWKNHA